MNSKRKTHNTENDTMPLELKPGLRIQIPCRNCAETLLAFTVKTGDHAVDCPRCRRTTKVRVASEEGRLRIHTSASEVGKSD